jgi:rhamnosyl/mannosyltransferase
VLSIAGTDTVFARPIQVCHLGKFYPPATGGIERHVQALARAQAEMGAKVRVVCINHLNGDGRDVTWSRYGMTRTIEDTDGAVRVTRLGRSASVARFDVIPGLPRLLMDLQYSPVDIVHLHMPNPTMLLTLACLRLSKPLVVTHHSDVISQRWLVHIMRPLKKIVYRRAAALIATSQAYVEGSPVLQRYRDKVAIVPMGIDLAPFAEPSAEALREAANWRRQLCGDGPLWLSVGRCVYYKGQHTAIAALRRLPGRLLVIGEGPLVRTLQKQASDQGVEDRVVFAGRASEAQLAGAYLAATALLFTSTARSEAYGLAQIEAMAAGCPVINTKIAGSGVDWVSKHGESGLTVEVDNPTSVAAAARRLLDEPGLRGRLSAGARRRALELFGREKMAERSLDLYARVLREAVGAGRVLDAVDTPAPRLATWIRRASNDVRNSSSSARPTSGGAMA